MTPEEVIQAFGNYLILSAGFAGVAYDHTNKDNTTNLPFAEFIINETTYPTAYSGYQESTSLDLYCYFTSVSGAVVERGQRKKEVFDVLRSEHLMNYMRNVTEGTFVNFANVTISSVQNDSDAGIFVDAIKVIVSCDLITVIPN